MAYRNGNYAAFYVAEPFSASNLGANATKDFIYYRELQAWKGKDASFPFIDSHDKNYNVRDNSGWESTLKPRLHERLRNSKNIILFLSSVTESSKALDEEMNYGIGELGLPVIAVYPELEPINANGTLKASAVELWDNLPSFKKNKSAVPVIHVSMKKDELTKALESSDFMIQTKAKPGNYRL